MNTALSLMLHLVGLTLLATCDAVLLRSAWRHNRLTRLLAGLLPVVAAVVALSFHLAWPGEGTGRRILAVRIMSGCFVVLASVFPALIVSWLMLRREPVPVGAHVAGSDASAAYASPAPRCEDVPDEGRRRLLSLAAASVPLLATAGAGAGILGGSAGARVFVRPLASPGLPAELDGLRILHLSDLHLGSSLDLPGLEEILRRAAGLRPDLIALTGDVADDPGLLPAALELIAGFEAPLGAYATLGNHEYGHGVESALAAYSAGDVPLLRESGVLIAGPRGDFRLAGTDDPAGTAAQEKRIDFYRRGLAAAIAKLPAGLPLIVLAHRPDIFPLAAAHGADIVLAGHTHGGQVGVMGRSIFDPPWDRNFVWGVYAEHDSRLHVTAGAGQWFPFRLGCPPEAPVLELRRG